MYNVNLCPPKAWAPGNVMKDERVPDMNGFEPGTQWSEVEYSGTPRPSVPQGKYEYSPIEDRKLWIPYHAHRDDY